MGKNSDNLAAQLYDLKLAGEVELPEVARLYSQSTQHLSNTGSQVNLAAPAMERICDYRDTIQYFLVRTFHSLIANGSALAAIADDYATTDKLAADEMQRLWDERKKSLLLTPKLPPIPEPILPAGEQYRLPNSEPAP